MKEFPINSDFMIETQVIFFMQKKNPIYMKFDGQIVNFKLARKISNMKQFPINSVHYF